MQFSRDEQERYQRHFSLPKVGREGQMKLKSARLLIIGAGGLGCPAALYLAAAGVGHLCVIDPDVVSLSNLQRQILFRTAEVGESKAEIATAHLRELNPQIEFTAIRDSLNRDNGPQLVTSYDIVIDASDNFETRYLVNDLCVEANRPFIFGAIHRFDAQVSVFHYNEGPCYRCVYPKPPPLEAVSNCSAAGVLGVLPGTVGTLMANEALKMILQIGEVASGCLVHYDSLKLEMQKRKIMRNSMCVSCGEGRQVALKSNFKAQPFKLSQHTNDFFVLDVRNENEFAEKHLPNANHISLAHLRASIEKIPRDKKILLVCQSGKRSARASEILNDFGFSDLYELTGGMDGSNL